MGDEEGVLSLDDDQIPDTHEGDAGGACGEDNIAAGVLGGEVLRIGGVVVLVMAKVLGDSDPTADVVPIEAGLDDEDAPGFFHDGVVDGDLRQFREAGGEGCGEIAAGVESLDEVSQGGGVVLEG